MKGCTLNFEINTQKLLRTDKLYIQDMDLDLTLISSFIDLKKVNHFYYNNSGLTKSNYDFTMMVELDSFFFFDYGSDLTINNCKVI